MQIDNGLLLYQFSSLVSNIMIQLVVLTSLVDILTGMSVGLKCRELSSTRGLNGVIKHMCVITLILLVYPYMRLLNLQVYANVFVGFYIVSYLISILENLAKLGAPVPTFVKKYLSMIRCHLNKGGKIHKVNNIHVVKVGETLSQIARQHSTTVDELLKLNPGIKNVNLLYVGEVLELPNTL